MIYSYYTMSSWSVIKSLSFRVKQSDGKAKETKIDIHLPLKSLEELETKSGVKCPDDRKKEIIESLSKDISSNGPTWLENVTVPTWYTTADPINVTNALLWGYEMVQAQGKMSEEKLHEQLDLKWKKLLDKTLFDFDEFKKETSQQLSQKENELSYAVSQKEKEIQTWKQTAISNLNASEIESKIQKAKQEWEDTQRNLMTIAERERQSLKEQQQEWKERVEGLQLQVSKIEQQREILQGKLEQKVNHDALMNKSVLKGQVGEKLVDSWLRTAFFGSKITNTSKDDDNMDSHVIWEGTTIMVDAKNHHGALHSLKDVKKFHDNLRNHPEASVGILLCLNTHVQNHDRFWVEMEITNENKLAIYMNKVSENPIERLQLVAGSIIQSWKEYIKLHENIQDKIAGDELKIWSDNARTILTKGWNLIIRLQCHWSKTQTAIQSSMTEFNAELSKVVDDIHTDLNTLNIAVEIPKETAKKVRTKKT